VHNLEHGYNLLWYDDTVAKNADELAVVKAIAAKFEGQKLSGAAFDRAYMRDMVQDHTQDVGEFDRESNNGKDPQVKDWAGQKLPTLREHLTMAKDINGKLTAGTSGKVKKPGAAPKKPGR
jgi:predicted outer membrane protein